MATSARSSDRGFAIAGGVLIVVFAYFSQDREPFDDALFFKRFALNALDHGVLAWNVADGPVYGITSQLFQLVVLAVTAVTRTYTLLAVRALDALAVLAALLILLRTTARHDGGLAAAFAMASPIVLYAIPSGMETALVFSVLAAAIASSLRPGSSSALVVGLAWLAWLTRPDVLLLVLPLLAAGRRETTGKWPLRELLAVAVLVLLSMALFRVCYGTALPLPFYAKARFFSPYDEHVVELSHAVRRVRSGLFAVVAAPLVLLGLRARDRVQLALLGASLAFAAYHFCFTLELMGMQARFYAPTLPLLVVAGARGAAASRRPTVLLAAGYAVLACLVVAFVIQPKLRGDYERASLLHLGLVVFAGAAMLALGPEIQSGNARLWLVALVVGVPFAERPSMKWPADENYLTTQASHVTVYRGLEVLRACFGDAIDLYHTEIGLPGLRFPGGTVTDLAGLMSERLLFRRATVESVCREDPPEAIFLPHKHYRGLVQAMLSSTCLRGYERVVAESSSPLYVRKDLVARYRECASHAP